MKKLQEGYAGVFLLVWLSIILIGGWGWISNIIKLVGMDLDHITGMLVVRAIGIVVPPLGMVMGYL